MARRFDHSTEEITEMTLSWVADFLTTQPVESLSLRQVAKGIGYSPGTLINVFGSYSLLLLRVNADTLDRLTDAMTQAMTAESDSEAQLYAMADAYLSFALHNRHIWRLVFELKLPEEEALPDWQQQRIDQLLTMLKGLLRSMHPSAEDLALEQTARVIWAGVHGISVLAVEDKLFSPAELDNRHMVQTLIKHYLAGWQSAGLEI
jgi:AcrR family transcriptional regulator